MRRRAAFFVLCIFTINLSVHIPAAVSAGPAVSKRAEVGHNDDVRAPLTRLDRDFAAGVVTLDDYVKYSVFMAENPDLLPPRYRGDSVDPFVAASNVLPLWKNVSRQTRAELRTFLSIRPVNRPLAAKFDPEGGGGGSACVALANESGGYSFAFERLTPNFKIIYNVGSGESPLQSPQDLKTYQLPTATSDGAVQDGGNGCPDFIDQLGYTLEHSWKAFDGLNFELPSSRVDVVVRSPQGGTFEEGCNGSGFADPVDPGLNRLEISPCGSPFYLGRHEPFHIVQYHYVPPFQIFGQGDETQSWWWLEASADWAAKQVLVPEGRSSYDDALPSLLGTPSEGLISPLIRPEERDYGGFLFAQFLEERVAQDAVRQVWTRMAQPDFPGADQAIGDVLSAADGGWSWYKALEEFWNAAYQIGRPGVWSDSDVTLWRDVLNQDSRTAADDRGEGRPARDSANVARGGGTQTGSLAIAPGGASFIDVLPAPGDQGLLKVTVASTDGGSPDIHSRVNILGFSQDGHPTRCGENPVPSSDGTTISFEMALGYSCRFATLSVVNTEPSPYASVRTFEWAAELKRNYSAEVIEDDPAAYWRLNEADEALVALDSSGHGLHGSYLWHGQQYRGTVDLGVRGAIKDDPYTAGRFGGSGADLFVNDDPLGGESIDQLSAEAWVRTSPGAGSWASTEVKTAVGRAGMFGLGTRGWKPYAAVNTPSGRQEVTGPRNIHDGAWHHLAMTYDGSSLKLFVDGEPQSTSASGPIAQNPAQPLFVGSSYGVDSQSFNSTRFPGDIDEVAVYDHVVDGSRFSERFDSRWEKKGECSSTDAYTTIVCADEPVGYWRFRETSQSQPAVDHTGINETGGYPGFDQYGGAKVLLGQVNAVKVANDAAIGMAGDSVKAEYEEYGTYASDHFTVEGWVRLEDSAGGYPRYLITRDGTLRLGVGPKTLPSGRISTRAKAEVSITDLDTGVSSDHSLMGGRNLFDGKWHHLALTYNGTTLRLFADAKEVASKAAPGIPKNISMSQLTFGTLGSSRNYLIPGDIDEVAVYDHALTVGDMAQRFEKRRKRDPNCPLSDGFAGSACLAQPIGYWRLGDASGSSVTDVSGVQNGTYGADVELGRQGATTDAGTTAVATKATSEGYVTIPYEDLGTYATDRVTASAWVRTSESTGERYVLYRPGAFNLGVLNGKPFATLWATTDDEMTSTTLDLSADTAIFDGQWHHLALSYDGTTGRLVVDGNEEDASTFTGNLDVAVNQPIKIGQGPRWDYSFVGDIGDVALYDHALTDGQLEDQFSYRWSPSPQCSGTNAYTNVVCASDPIGYWRLNGGANVVDFTGLRNGTYGAGVVKDKVGAIADDEDKGIETKATSDGFAEVPWETYGTYANDKLTAETWVKTSRNDGDRWAIHRPGSFALGTRNGKAVASFTMTGSSSNPDLLGTTTVSDGNWHHLAVTYDGSIGKLYVDGVAEASFTYGGTLGHGTNNSLKIGQGSSATYGFVGDLDEVALYDHALTQGEMTQRFALRRPPASPPVASCNGTGYVAAVCTDEPVGYWRFEEASGTTANDLTTNQNNGSYTGVELNQAGVPGIGGKAASFNVSSMTVPSASSLDLSGRSYSLEAWIKPTGNGSTGYKTLFNRGGTGDRKIYVLLNPSDRLYRYEYFDSGATLSRNAWHHVVYTFDATTDTSGTERFYVDGALAGSRTGGVPASGAGPYFIGAANGNDHRFEGLIDEVAIYGSRLSSDRVSAHYQAGSGETNPPLEPCDYRADVLSDQPTGFWRLAESSGTTASSEVPSTPGAGTYTGFHTLNQVGATADSNGSVDLQGGHVSLGQPGALGTNSAWTVEAWVNPSQAPDNGAALISEAYAGDNNVRFALGYGDGTNKIWAGFYGGSWIRAHDPQDLALNNWTHFVGTYNGSQLKLYRNGQLVATTNTSAAIPNGNETIYIGRRWDSSNSVRGRIDDVAVYPTALSAARIENHYTCGTG